MAEIKDSLKTIAFDLGDLITEVEDSDELDDDTKAEIIDSLEEAESNMADALLCL